MSRETTRLLVYRPRVLWTAALLSVALLGGLVYLAHQLGIRVAGHELVELRAQAARLKRAKSELLARNRELAERVAVLERGSQIDAAAYREIEEDCATLENQIIDLKEELALYHGIVAPEKGRAGVQAQALELENLLETGHVRFQLLLTQSARKHNLVKGVVKFRIRGTQGGKAVTLERGGVAGESGASLAYKFRYFQNLEGEFRLPPDFEPAEVVVELSPEGKKKTIERVFGWST